MKTLSIKQPWASLIAHGIKDIENRTWKTKFRGKIYIHACAEPKSKADIYSFLNQSQWEEVNDSVSLHEYNPYKLQFSAIIGEVEIIDCIRNSDSIWAEKTDVIGKTIEGEILCKEKPIYNWVLSNPILYDKPILNVKGKLSFWDYSIK